MAAIFVFVLGRAISPSRHRPHWRTLNVERGPPTAAFQPETALLPNNVVPVYRKEKVLLRNEIFADRCLGRTTDLNLLVSFLRSSSSPEHYCQNQPSDSPLVFPSDSMAR